MVKTSGLRIFVDFFSPVLVTLVGAGVGEGGVATTPIAVPEGGGGEMAVKALVGRPAGGGGGVPAAGVIVELLPAKEVGSRV